MFRLINKNHIQQVYKNGLLDSSSLEEFETCEPCLLGKITKELFTGHGERIGGFLDLTHSDVYGSINKQASGGDIGVDLKGCYKDSYKGYEALN